MAIISKAEAEAVIASHRPDLVTASENVEDAHLEFASNILNEQNWVGSMVSASQTDSWPRQYVPIDRFNTSIGYRDSSIIPTEIQLIVALLAIRFYSNPGITADSASGIAVTGVTLPDSSYDLLGDHIRASIRPFLNKSGVFTRVN